MRRPFILLVAGSGMIAGCNAPHIPNPNEPADVGPLSAATVRGNLRAVTDALETRLEAGEITPARYKQLVEQAASEIVAGANVAETPPAHAWELGEVLKDAHQWRLAETELQIAVRYAKQTHNEDRLVNDSLRLAVVLAHEGKVEEAIDTAHSVFDAPPTETAPVLLATYIELVPAARGHGHDSELGKLVEEAIEVELRTKVDPSSDAGKMFIAARPFHVNRAREVAAELERVGVHAAPHAPERESTTAI